MAENSPQFVVREVVDEDLDLVHAAQSGDISAFDQLVRRYDQKLFRIAQTITHNREDSQDAVQETFLSVFQHLEAFRESAGFSTWLIRIVVNQSLMKLRKRNRTKEISLDERLQPDGETVPIDIADWVPNPEERYQVAELRAILARALEALRPNDRTIFVLRDIEGLSIEQAAEVLSLTCASVKSRLFRARLQLRQILSAYFSKQKQSAFRSRLSLPELMRMVSSEANVPIPPTVNIRGANCLQT